MTHSLAWACNNLAALRGGLFTGATMQFPTLLFKQAGLTSGDVAALCGVSRITGYRWLKGTSRSGAEGVGVNVFLQAKVSTVASRVGRAVASGDLPDAQLAKLTAAQRVKTLRSILNQYRKQK
jgi:hypothetical protein